MYIAISLSAAIAPAIILVIYFYKQDRAKPEPKKLVLKIFFFGIISTIPAIILELLVGQLKPFFSINPLLFYFFEAFLVASLCEEGIKLYVVRQSAYKTSAFDEVADGIVYTVIASLGFACLENVLYVLEGGLSLAILRAFTSIPLHTTASGFMGYYIGLAKFAATPGEQRGLIFKGFIIAFLIHGYYDFVLFGMDSFGILPALTIIPLLIIGFIKLRGLMKSAIAQDQAAGRV